MKPHQNGSDCALVGRTMIADPESGAGRAVHTPTAPDSAGNLPGTAKPTEKWQLLGQVTRKQPSSPPLFAARAGSALPVPSPH